MDDRNFDLTTALEWIRVIEDPSAIVRETDIFPLLRAWLSNSTAKNVLDIGCGQGDCSRCLGPKISYVGVDPSPDLIRRALELYSAPTKSFIVGNAYELPFPDKHFRAVFSIAVWHLLSDLEKASSELSRVLEEKGSFLIVTADPNQYQLWMDRYQEQKIEGTKFTGSNANSDGSRASDILHLYSLERSSKVFERNACTSQKHGVSIVHCYFRIEDMNHSARAEFL